MPWINIRDFRGIDRRQLRGTGRPNRLWDADNVYIEPGGRLRRRPPLQFFHACSIDIKGLYWIGNRFHGWHDRSPAPDPSTYPGATTTVNGVTIEYRIHPAIVAGKTLSDVVYANQLNGHLFAVAKYADGATRYFVDDVLVPDQIPASGADPARDNDVPHTEQVAIASSRVFAPDGEVVRFCRAGNPADWSGTDDAGFLPVGRVAGGSTDIRALVGWRSRLLVFFQEQVQVWTVGLDPVTEHELEDVIEGYGTDRPGSVVALDDMVVFRSQSGYRAIAANQFGRPVLVEVGLPVDDLTEDPDRAEAAEHEAVFASGFSQYINVRASRAADVMHWTRSGNALPAWTTYSFPNPVRHPTSVGPRLWLRNGDTGAIGYMNEEVPHGTEYRDFGAEAGDRTAAGVTGSSSLATAVAIPNTGASGYVGGTTVESNDGPSADTNSLEFQAWPVYLQDDPRRVDLTVLPAFVDPSPGTLGDVAYEIVYCLAALPGTLPGTAGAYIETSMSSSGDDWRFLALLQGWHYASDYRQGDALPGPGGTLASASHDGGWRRVRFFVRDAIQRMRIRITDPVTPPTVTTTQVTETITETITEMEEVEVTETTSTEETVIFVAGHDFEDLVAPGADRNVWRWDGQDWSIYAAFPSGAPSDSFPNGMARNPSNGDLWLMWSSARGIFRHDGTTWHEEGIAPTASHLASRGIAIHPTTGDLYIVGLNNSRLFRRRASAGSSGSWTQIADLSDYPSVVTHSPTGLAFHPTTGALYILFGGGGVFEWDEDADTLTRVAPEIPFQTLVSSVGGLAVDPGNSDFLVAGQSQIGGSFALSRASVVRYDRAGSQWVAEVTEPPFGSLDANGRVRDGIALLAIAAVRETITRTTTRTETRPVEREVTREVTRDVTTTTYRDPTNNFCLHSFSASKAVTMPYRSFVDFAFAAAGFDSRKKRWQGVRVEQDGTSEFRLAVRGEGGGAVRRVPRDRWLTVAGDTSSARVTALGAVSVEAAPEFQVTHAEPWELSSIGLQVELLGEWA